MINFLILLPPSANALTRNLRGGGRASTAAYRAWLEDAGYHVTTKWRACGRPTFAPPLRITVELGLDGRRRDAGNCLKPIEDMLVKSIEGLPDDRWNDEITIRRATDVPTGAARVTIASIDPPS